jgi:molybdate transport system permease protein
MMGPFDWPAVRVSLLLAGSTTVILGLLGIPVAAWLAHTHWRGRHLLEALLTLPLVLPPTVVGFYLLWATAGTGLPFTFGGILLASVLVNVPFALRPFLAAFQAVPRRLQEAAWCLGASRVRTFWTITVPLAGPGLLAGLVLTFLHTLGEFGVVLMVGGNRPGRTRTLSISIFDDVQALDYAAAHRTALALVLASFVAVWVVPSRSRRAA